MEREAHKVTRSFAQGARNFKSSKISSKFFNIFALKLDSVTLILSLHSTLQSINMLCGKVLMRKKYNDI